MCATYAVADPLGATLVSPFVVFFGAPVAFTVLIWFQLAMSGTVPLPLPDLSGPPGRIGVSVLEPHRFPTLAHV